MEKIKLIIKKPPNEKPGKTATQAHIPKAHKTSDSYLSYVALLNALRKFPKVNNITSP